MVIPFRQRATPARASRQAGQLALGAAAAALPVAAYIALRMSPGLDATFGSGSSHFYIVSAVAALALILAGAVAWAARGVHDGRTFFLAMAFFSMAAIFLAHGLGTSPFYGMGTHGATTAAYAPDDADGSYAYVSSAAIDPGSGAHEGHDATPPLSPAITAVSAPGIEEFVARMKVVGYSARLSIFVSALFFALAVIDLPERLAGFVARRWGRLVAMTSVPLAGHVYLALERPQLLAWIPLQSEPLSWGLACATWACLAFAGWRFLQAYRIALLPLQGAMALGMVLLGEAQFIMVTGELWHVSWWEYHILMLAGFLTCVGALLHQYRATGDLSAIVEGLFLRRQVAGLRAGDSRALTVLTAAVAAKDSETAEHINRVGDFSVAIARRLWLPPERLEVVRLAGRLHDAGKIGVANRILRKPGPLTPEEFEEMKLHSIRGWLLAIRSGMLAEAAPIIRSHHERLDGSGYPDALRGNAISMEARIVAVADVWDALTCDRPYRKAMTANDAAEILIKESASHLDPRAVQALFEEVGLATKALRAA
jgi:HD-GYP domain-containing protein (c-di-GMP phosphodiesterase class II)